MPGIGGAGVLPPGGTSGAICSSRARASSASGMQITFPSSVATSITAAAWGMRSVS